jgi:RsiW-degrading membrane proteinase PrsW (M82 family)/ribosomal protein L32
VSERRGGDRRRSNRRRAADPPAELEEGPPLVSCPHCGMAVPLGEFCGHCGAHLGTANVDRRHAFAAVPSEAVVHVAVISTLFPHLAHRRGAAFRWALLGGGATVLLLAALHLYAPATAVATFLLPALYLLYLYEVEVYEDEPWLVIGATLVAGAALGYVFTAFFGGEVSRLSLTGDRGNAFLLSGVLLPLVAQLLMLLGPFFLFFVRTRFRQPLDGLTFGAASALGFTLASSLTAFWPEISEPLIGTGSPVDWTLRLLRVGLIVALINASTTALIAASVWLYRYDKRRMHHWEASLPAAVTVAFGAQLALGIFEAWVLDLVAQVVVGAIVAVAVLLYLRQVIHQALLAEGAAHEIGPDAPCPECGRIVPTMLFCPACGVARLAGSKAGRRKPRTAT